jgi:hypothetical protein
MFNLPKTPGLLVLCALSLDVAGSGSISQIHAAEPAEIAGGQNSNAVVRIAACQAKRRSIDWRIKKPADVLAAAEANLDELEKIVNRAGEAGCDARFNSYCQGGSRHAEDKPWFCLGGRLGW